MLSEWLSIPDHIMHHFDQLVVLSNDLWENIHCFTQTCRHWHLTMVDQVLVALSWFLGLAPLCERCRGGHCACFMSLGPRLSGTTILSSSSTFPCTLNSLVAKEGWRTRSPCLYCFGHPEWGGWEMSGVDVQSGWHGDAIDRSLVMCNCKFRRVVFKYWC